MVSKLALDVLVNVKGADKLQGLGGQLQRTGQNLTKWVTLPVLGAGAAAFKFASDADEASSKAQTVFGDAFTSIADDAASLDDAFSQAQFLDSAGTFGAIAQGMGATRQESADLSNQWVDMAQDFASFNNVGTDEALTAIRSALSGEFEPLKRFGVLINVAKVQAKALEMGLIEEGEALDDNARLMATNALILEGMGPAMGDFARTADGAANSTRNLAANSEDLGAAFGTALLPIGQQVLGFLNSMVTAFVGLPGPVQTGIVAVAGIGAALGPVLLIGRQFVSLAGLMKTGILNIPTALGYFDLALSKTGAAFNVLKVALLSNPFVALAAAAVAIAVLIVLNWDKIVAAFQELWKMVQKIVGAIVDFLSDVWDNIIDAATSAWEGLVGVIKGAINGVIGLLNGFIGFINGIQIHIPAIGVGPVQTPAFDWNGLQLASIPYLAEGGIVTAPTLALIGEQGTEAVVPLDRLPTNITRIINLEIQAPLRADDIEDVTDYQRRAERLDRAMEFAG